MSFKEKLEERLNMFILDNSITYISEEGAYDTLNSIIIKDCIIPVLASFNVDLKYIYGELTKQNKTLYFKCFDKNEEVLLTILLSVTDTSHYLTIDSYILSTKILKSIE